MFVSVIREIPGKYRFFTSLAGKRRMRFVVPVLLLSITFGIFYPSLSHGSGWNDRYGNPALAVWVTSGCSFYLFCVWFAGLGALYTYDRREDGTGLVISYGGGTLLQQYSVYIDRTVGGVHRKNIPASEGTPRVSHFGGDHHGSCTGSIYTPFYHQRKDIDRPPAKEKNNLRKSKAYLTRFGLVD